MALPTLRIIGFIIGIFLITLAVGMAVPMATLVIFERTGDMPSFLWSSLITFIAGLAMVLRRPEHAPAATRHVPADGLQLAVVCVFAALPFLLTQHISYTDAFFESMSGITATGATVLSGLDSMSPGILMWRSMLHWLGGIGFIAMAVAILPPAHWWHAPVPDRAPKGHAALTWSPSRSWGYTSASRSLARWLSGGPA